MSQQITEQNFQVIIRVRPLNTKEQEQIQAYEYAQSKKFKASNNNKMVKLSPQAYAFYTKFYNVSSLSEVMKVQNNQTIFVIDTEYKNMDRKMKPYSFAHVYNQKETSDQIFAQSIFDQMQGIFEGYNYTILAYGITGSGKTHTVFGSQEKNQRGISGLALNHLLEKKKALEKQTKAKVNLGFSFVQIYNQNVRDLLSSEAKMLNIIEDSKGNTSFTDAIQIQIHNQDQIHDLINIGLAKRSSGATMANQYSSRSHAIIQMNVQIVAQNSKITSKMFIIDLAGSEKIQTLNTAKKMLEGANINKSLLALGNCINILAENSKKGMNGSTVHIPYRDSKLTRILKDSLGGNAKTLMIACVSENPFTIEQTITTLNYAQRAQGIRKEVKRNRPNAQQQQRRLCVQCARQLSGDCDGAQYITDDKICLPQSLSRSTINDEQKDEMLATFFQQIYEDIVQNTKERVSIERVLATEGRNRGSNEDIQKLREVNQSQRLQLKQTMWKLFTQKQQDYSHKLAQLHQFINTLNSSHKKKQKNNTKSHPDTPKTRTHNQQNQAWTNSPDFSKNNSTEKHNKPKSLSRKPLADKDNNHNSLHHNSLNQTGPHDSIKFLLTKDEPLQLSDENSHVRFSFASLLTSDVTRGQAEQDQQLEKSHEKLTKRKKSRTKFEVVKKMSASKVDSNSKEIAQNSL